MARATPIQHGVNDRCYRRGCRRPECRDAYRNTRKRADLRRARGIPGSIDGQRIARHLTNLINSGWTRLQIAESSGVSDRAIRYILAGQREVHLDNAARLLSIKPKQQPQRVAPTGTIRRIQALACIGWSIKHVATESGYSYSYFARILNGSSATIPAAAAENVAHLYRSLAARPGTSDHTRKIARRNGWHPPTAWDDIDDPAAQPETDSPELAAPGRCTYVADEARHLASFGISTHEVARRVGRSESYVRQILAGDRGPGWRDQLEAAA